MLGSALFGWPAMALGSVVSGRPAGELGSAVFGQGSWERTFRPAGQRLGAHIKLFCQLAGELRSALSDGQLGSLGLLLASPVIATSTRFRLCACAVLQLAEGPRSTGIATERQS